MSQHFTGDLQAQLAEHQAGYSARLCMLPGPPGSLGRSPGRRERQLEAQGGSYCPNATSRRASPPAAQRKEPAAMKQPPDRDVHHPQGTRPPEYVIVTWVSEQLRDRIQRNNAALAQDRQDPGRQAHGRRAEPEAELEAEP
jgi:hypothetical protein